MRRSNRMKRILREQCDTHAQGAGVSGHRAGCRHRSFELPHSLLPIGLRSGNKRGKKSMTRLTLNFIRSASSISARRLRKGWS